MPKNQVLILEPLLLDPNPYLQIPPIRSMFNNAMNFMVSRQNQSAIIQSVLKDEKLVCTYLTESTSRLLISISQIEVAKNWVVGSIIVPLETEESVELFVNVLLLQYQGQLPDARKLLFTAQNTAISKVRFSDLSV